MQIKFFNKRFQKKKKKSLLNKILLINKKLRSNKEDSLEGYSIFISIQSSYLLLFIYL